MQVTLKKRSFFDYITAKPRAIDIKFYDPMKIRIGSSVMIKTLELEKYEFRLQSIEEYERTIGGKEFVFTDYNLTAKPIGQDPIKIKLRVNPISGAKTEDGKDYSILLLTNDFEGEFDQGLYEDIQKSGETKKWFVKDGDDETEYFRLNDISEPFVAKVGVLTDEDNNGVFDVNELGHEEVSYWDFGREIDLAGGFTETEFFFVEVNERNGWIRMWKGTEIIETKVTVL